MTGTVFTVTGVLLLGGLWLGPLPSLAVTSFTAHMTLHMGVVALAAPLLAFGLAGRAADPVRVAPAIFSPLPAAALELAIVWAWHTPVLHLAARQDALWLVAEQASFLSAGWIVWMSAFGGDERQAAGRTGSGIVALLLTSMHMTLLGALLALAPRPLYAHHAASASLGAALDDQHLGGAIMLLVGGISYLAGGVWLSRRMLLLRSGRPA